MAYSFNPFISNLDINGITGPIQRSLQAQNWTNITTNSMNVGGATLLTSSWYGGTTRTRCVVPQGVNIESVALVYTNNSQLGSGWTPNSNMIRIRASILAAPSSGYTNTSSDQVLAKLSFPANGLIRRGESVVSNPVQCGFSSGTTFFIHTYVDANMPAAPAAPTCTGNTGSGSPFVAGQTYGVALTYVWPDGSESLASAATTVTIGSNANVIVVTSPSDPLNGSIGYRVWQTVFNNAGGTAYDAGVGVVPYSVANVTLLKSFTVNTQFENVVPGALGYFPTGGAVSGATGTGQSASGEGVSKSYDCTQGGYLVPGLTGNGGCQPIVVLGLDNTGVGRSLSGLGDSIMQATADNGFNSFNSGGWAWRATQNQTAGVLLDTSKVPFMGFSMFGVGGETAAYCASNNGTQRSNLANLSTSVLSEYGTNDLSSGVCTLIKNQQIIALRALNPKRYFYLSELNPRPGSSDGFQTLANQTLVAGALSEACRRAYNNWGADTTGAVTYSESNMFQGFAGAVGPTYNIYGGANGTATQFWFAYPCLQGSEVITNGGAACTYSASPSGQNQYSYLLTATINGSTYISGIQFGSAPSNGNAIAATYTKIAGFVPLLGTNCTWLTGPATALEINGSGAFQVNGGFCRISDAPLVGPRAVTATSSSSLTDSTQTWTVNQWAGYCVLIVTDSVTPTAVGQVQCIGTNTATVLSAGSWNVTPSTSATYAILKSYIANTPHPSSFGHMAIASAINLALIQ